MSIFDILAILIGLAMMLGFLTEIVRHFTLAWLAKTMTDDQITTFVALRDAKAGGAKPCPCRDLHSMTVTPGSTFELPAGTVLSSGTDADRKVVSVTEVPIQVEGDPNFTYRLSTKGTVEVRKAFADVAASLNLKKGH